MAWQRNGADLLNLRKLLLLAVKIALMLLELALQALFVPLQKVNAGLMTQVYCEPQAQLQNCVVYIAYHFCWAQACHDLRRRIYLNVWTR